MSVEALLQPFLVQIMANKTDAPARHKECVKTANFNEVLRFLGTEGSTLVEQIHKESSDTTVNIEDQIRFLGGGYLFNLSGVIKERGSRKVSFSKVSQSSYSQVWIVQRLYSMSNTLDILVGGFHLVNELVRSFAFVISARELSG